MGKRIRVWGWQDPTQVLAQEMTRRAKSEQQGDTMQYEYSPMQLAEITDFSFLKEWDTIRIMPEGYNEEEEREEQGDTMFRDLTKEETEQFQEYARTNLPGRSDWSAFHPVCREVWWKLACEHDGFDPAACFVVFSDDNPYIAEETP